MVGFGNGCYWFRFPGIEQIFFDFAPQFCAPRQLASMVLAC